MKLSLSQFWSGCTLVSSMFFIHSTLLPVFHFDSQRARSHSTSSSRSRENSSHNKEQLRKNMLEHLTKEIQEVKENYTDHMTELFFLQVRHVPLYNSIYPN